MLLLVAMNYIVGAMKRAIPMRNKSFFSQIYDINLMNIVKY